MKNSLFILTIYFTSFFCLAQTETQKKTINSIFNKYENSKSMEYDIDYSIKTYDDTLYYKYNSNVKLKRLKNDKTFGGKLFYGIELDSTINNSKYYDGRYLYLFDKNNNKTHRYNVEKNETFIITSSFDGAMLKSLFFETDKLKKQLNLKENIVTYIDTANYLKVNVKFPDDGSEYFGLENDFYFNKNSRTLDKKTFTARYKDQTQKNIWIFKNIKFNTVTDLDFDREIEKFKNFPIEDYKPRSKDFYKLLENEKEAPLLSGRLYPNYENDISVHFNKVTILDFWYTTCAPCIEAIPHLNELYKKYNSKIEIIGVNSFNEKEKEKFKTFLNREPIDYPILFIDKIPNEYNIQAFPTLYIIGKDGKVKFSKIGCPENLYEILEVQIENLLNN